jgi:hypothetical protein
MAKSYFIKLNKIKKLLSMFNIKRAGSIGARLAFYKCFYNLDKIYEFNCLAVNRVYK